VNDAGRRRHRAAPGFGIEAPSLSDTDLTDATVDVLREAELGTDDIDEVPAENARQAGGGLSWPPIRVG
jgi:hypothetical protein